MLGWIAPMRASPGSVFVAADRCLVDGSNPQIGKDWLRPGYVDAQIDSLVKAAALNQGAV